MKKLILSLVILLSVKSYAQIDTTDMRQISKHWHQVPGTMVKKEKIKVGELAGDGWYNVKVFTVRVTDINSGKILYSTVDVNYKGTSIILDTLDIAEIAKASSAISNLCFSVPTNDEDFSMITHDNAAVIGCNKGGTFSKWNIYMYGEQKLVFLNYYWGFYLYTPTASFAAPPDLLTFVNLLQKAKSKL